VTTGYFEARSKAADNTPEEPNLTSKWGFGPCSKEDASLLDEIVYDIYLDRRIGAHGLELLEAAECLLDPETYQIPEEQAKDNLRAVVLKLRSGHYSTENWQPRHKTGDKQPGKP
jgi:hypothetical protein